MKQVVHDNFISFNRVFEGFTTWFYLDVKGYVTIGMGNLVDPIVPTLLKFSDIQGTPVSWSTVLDEWNVVKSMYSYRLKGGYEFRNHTLLRASTESIETLIKSELCSFETTLKTHFSNWDEYPADGQLGILSMAWALGPNFPTHWPKFTRLVLDGKWGEAGNESHMSEYGNPGIKPRNAANRALFINAGITTTPEELMYHVM